MYALPTALVRQGLWTYVQKLGGCICISWLVVGDFNQLLSEKASVVDLASGRIELNGYGVLWIYVDM